MRYFKYFITALFILVAVCVDYSLIHTIIERGGFSVYCETNIFAGHAIAVTCFLNIIFAALSIFPHIDE